MTAELIPPNPREQTRTAVDVAGAIILLLVQLGIGYFGFLFAALSAMDTSYCSTRPGDGYSECGDPVWIEVGVATAVIGGLILVLGVLIWMLARFRSGKIGSVAPAIGVVAQIVLAIAAFAIASQSGPV